MATMTLNATPRDTGRKGPSRRLRAQGLIPAVLYGHGVESETVSVSEAEFSRLLRHRSGTMIIDLKLDGGSNEGRLTVIREIQRDPVTGDVLHLDLQRISLKEKIHVQVPLHIAGVAPGVKEEGGILEYPVRHLEVKCFPNRIPDHIDVDVASLHIGHSIHVRDLLLDRTELEVLSEPEMVVVTVSAPRLLKTEAELAAEAAAAVAEEGAVAEAGAEAGAEGEEGKKGEEKKGDDKKEERKGRERGKDKE
jgi:large subunit ribosomal protein L25